MELSNHIHRILRLKEIQLASHIDAFLFTSPATIKCFCGYFYNFETGLSPFQFLPAALVIVPAQFMCIVIADNESFSPPTFASDVIIKPYLSYVHEKPLDFTYQFLIRLYEVFEQNDLTSAHLGIEDNSLPYTIFNSLKSRYPKLRFSNLSGEIANLKVVKDIDEIEEISKAAVLCDIGQTAVLKYARAGITELELFSLVSKEIESFAGTRVPIMADLVSGPRTASGGGIPSNKIIRQGDLILSDLTPCLNGYWGDSCNTVVIGEPTQVQRKTFGLINESLDKAIKLIRPGIRASELDRFLRKHVGNYPHHTGHGIGTTYHEEPRIVSYNDMELAPGMVIALEPGIYKKEYGIRLEHMVLVTETGYEVLTKSEHSFKV
jgi:Xaa-Pro aminopeptidase